MNKFESTGKQRCSFEAYLEYLQKNDKTYTKKQILDMFDKIPPSNSGNKLTWSEIKAYFKDNL